MPFERSLDVWWLCSFFYAFFFCFSLSLVQTMIHLSIPLCRQSQQYNFWSKHTTLDSLCLMFCYFCIYFFPHNRRRPTDVTHCTIIMFMRHDFYMCLSIFALQYFTNNILCTLLLSFSVQKVTSHLFIFKLNRVWNQVYCNNTRDEILNDDKKKIWL